MAERGLDGINHMLIPIMMQYFNSNTHSTRFDTMVTDFDLVRRQNLCFCIGLRFPNWKESEL